MKDLVENILDLAKVKRVDYADIRIVCRQREEIAVKNGRVDALTQNEDLGFGIRVLLGGSWGFACSSRVTPREMERTLDRAWKIARASSKIKAGGIVFPPAPPAFMKVR